MLFRIRMADYVIEVAASRAKTRDFCCAFITNEEPDIHIAISLDDIEYERFIHKEMYYKSEPSDDSLETLALLRKLSEVLIDHDAFTIHGAAIAVDNEGYIFTGASGVGKTTHIFKWGVSIPDMAIINGDKPFVVINHQPLIYGSPWAGKEGLYKNTSVPLKSIIILERSEENHIEQISFTEAFPVLYQQVYHSESVDRIRKTLNLLQCLKQPVSFYRFKCNNFKDDCFETSYNALRRKDIPTAGGPL